MLKNTFVSGRGNIKLDDVVNKLGTLEMRKYATFAAMNMILMTITKAQLLPFDGRDMRYPSLKFCNSYLLKNFTLIKALFILINRFYLSYSFFSF